MLRSSLDKRAWARDLNLEIITVQVSGPLGAMRECEDEEERARRESGGIVTWKTHSQETLTIKEDFRGVMNIRCHRDIQSYGGKGGRGKV